MMGGVGGRGQEAEHKVQRRFYLMRSIISLDSSKPIEV